MATSTTYPKTMRAHVREYRSRKNPVTISLLPWAMDYRLPQAGGLLDIAEKHYVVQSVYSVSGMGMGR